MTLQLIRIGHDGKPADDFTRECFRHDREEWDKAAAKVLNEIFDEPPLNLRQIDLDRETKVG